MDTNILKEIRAHLAHDLMCCRKLEHMPEMREHLAKMQVWLDELGAEINGYREAKVYIGDNLFCTLGPGEKLQVGDDAIYGPPLDSPKKAAASAQAASEQISDSTASLTDDQLCDAFWAAEVEVTRTGTIRNLAAGLRAVVDAANLQKPAAAEQSGEAVYLVSTGEAVDGVETYTRHDVRPPMCDAETLYTRPQPAQEPVNQQLLSALKDMIHHARSGKKGFAQAIINAADAIDSAESNAQPVPAMPEGWCFYSADFSLQSAGKSNAGYVTLIRDAAGRAAWHELSDEERESVPLYYQGQGRTVQEAIANAVSSILSASPQSSEEHEPSVVAPYGFSLEDCRWLPKPEIRVHERVPDWNWRAVQPDDGPVYKMLCAMLDSAPQPAPAVPDECNWVALNKAAESIVRQKPTWKRFIDDTPLSNDIAVWMADFALEAVELSKSIKEWNKRATLAAAPQPAQQLPSVIEEIAQQWDGCIYDAEFDVGQSIRDAGKRLMAGLNQQGDVQ